WWRKRLRSFGETTDISEYPHRGIEWCAATAPLVPRRASRPPPDRTRYASECDAVRYVTLWTTIAPRSPSPICHYIALALQRSFSFGSGCAAEQRHNLHGGFRSRAGGSKPRETGYCPDSA